MNTNKLTVNHERLKQTLQTFAAFGATGNNGVTRLALSEEDQQARAYLRQQCEALGLVVTTDDLGNMYSVIPGKQRDVPPVYLGSHLDTVKKGGRFDGVLGVAGALEVLRTVVEHKLELNVPLGLINFTNEEGARFEPSMMASGILAGKFSKDAMLQSTDQDGVSFGEALAASGFAGSAHHRLTDASAFLELHIEQGPVLEAEKQTIGAVECVVGMVCYEIEICGKSNHAGTTPQRMRHDALTAANACMTAFHEKLAPLDDTLVYTIGRFNVFPNIHTVIPGRAVFTLEARHQDEAVLAAVETVIQEVAGACSLPCQATKRWSRETVWFNNSLVAQVEESAKALGYPCKRMVSGAGHDAQFISSLVPTAMIFVPSRGGISHAEEEWTSWEDCEKGVNVLLETALKRTMHEEAIKQ
ncbi:Zn-dependent hydrolase [Shouchella clausii]|uniref:N-carbamoyl-L-amino acid amidohydrolase n=1 Tax=Shouchella clausii (strain KSM-K16) TaxID=66692 RepID=Q5WBE4_SHOC1|nr:MULTISPECIES: Zn-dependent hydrolase [Shouchella]KKI85210.1 allantoate amidohydrolase [Shouchella clausii]MCM3381751.1 Zn-dependent hydrolase [Shouchella rhizosphaerae]MDO7283997.1 Zn-dependent hydrolase [Shouchella clausii]MDO7304093.1 Zn-dependent hydrolase [Shouchella clausii]PAE80857.1 Zn-dependent hydrolase [Shouchella clausii]